MSKLETPLAPPRPEEETKRVRADAPHPSGSPEPDAKSDELDRVEREVGPKQVKPDGR